MLPHIIQSLVSKHAPYNPSGNLLWGGGGIFPFKTDSKVLLGLNKQNSTLNQ